MDGKKLTVEELQALNPEELQELVIQNQDAYDKLKSDTTKGAQKVLDEKKLLEKAMTTVIKDKESLSSIHETDPELANAISQKLFWEDYTGIQKQEVSVDEIVEQKLAAKEVNKKFSKVVSQLGDDIKDKFDAEYKELTDWKNVTPENVDKFIKAALSLVQSEAKDNKTLDYIKSVSVGNGSGGKSTSWGKKQDEERKAYVQRFLS